MSRTSSAEVSDAVSFGQRRIGHFVKSRAYIELRQIGLPIPPAAEMPYLARFRAIAALKIVLDRLAARRLNKMAMSDPPALLGLPVGCGA